MTVRELYIYAKSELDGVSEACTSEALSILYALLGIDRIGLSIKGNDEVDTADTEKAKQMISQRKSGKPLQYIIGKAAFYGRDFSVGEGVLIPRFDTETVIDTAKELMIDKSTPTIIDLCSGSGAIAITLYKELPTSTVYAAELYDDAFKWLNTNAKKLDSDILPMQFDVIKSIPQRLSHVKFDMIVSNPPYIDSNAMQKLPDDVKCEPHTALFGGDDGLIFYREITRLWKPMLKSGGVLLFEIGFDQRKSVSEILSENGFTDITCKKDISGNDRVIFGTAK